LVGTRAIVMAIAERVVRSPQRDSGKSRRTVATKTASAKAYIRSGSCMNEISVADATSTFAGRMR
jgi:hypothetical protein